MRMEKKMEEYTQEIMKDPSVRGVLCTDTNGALYCSKGSLESAQCSAVVSQLANLAATLEPNSQPVATVLYCAPSASSSIPSSSSPIDSSQQQQNTSNTAGQGNSKVLIKTNGIITVAVHK